MYRDSLVFGPDYVRAIAPYVGGRPIAEVAREFGLDPEKIIKLASNENPLGFPNSARIAVQEALADLARYPDGNAFALKQALEKKFSVLPTWLTLGNGSNDILELVARACVQPGQGVIFSQYAFAVYALATQAIGGIAKVTPAKNYGHDLSIMLSAIDDTTRLIYLANPNNPTGTWLPPDEVASFLAKVPSRVVVVLDEAYTEYLPQAQRGNSIDWVRRFPNLLVSRTFSKAYGLAGLRIGFGVAQPVLTDLLNRVRQPFNVNSLGQVAACAVLDDEDFLARSAQINAQGYVQITDAVRKMGLEYVPSSGNFVLIKVGKQNAGAGMRVSQALLKLGVIVRPVANYDLPEHIRVSIGLPQENNIFLDALTQVMSQMPAGA
ncbi:MAG: histidinol-phosphate transaminase [Ottowia sp.]|nr:histidinol-phosphate transaminase [Ottowia sp.]